MRYVRPDRPQVSPAPSGRNFLWHLSGLRRHFLPLYSLHTPVTKPRASPGCPRASSRAMSGGSGRGGDVRLTNHPGSMLLKGAIYKPWYGGGSPSGEDCAEAGNSVARGKLYMASINTVTLHFYDIREFTLILLCLTADIQAEETRSLHLSSGPS